MPNTEEKTQETTQFLGSAEPHVFGTIQKDDDQLIMISLNNYKGYEYLDLRQWWKPKDQQDFLPTKQGFTVPIKDTLDYLEKLIETLEEAKNYLEKQGSKEQTNA